eukprot:jgi/Ulvmu1/9770/UM056_0010.1
MTLTLGVAVLACMQLGRAAEQDTFSRPNLNECASPQSPVNFLEYASSLGDVVECTGAACDYKEQAGLFFDLTYRQNYKVVKYNQLDVDVTYVLYQCGTEKPDDEFTKGLNATTTAFVEIPVTAVATGDSTAAWMLEELEVEDRVRYAAETATSPCMIKLALPQDEGGCNRPFRLDPTTFTPLVNVTDYDVQFAFGSSDSTVAKEVAFRISADPGPLRRVEHIVYMAAFFNLEAKAIKYFANVEAEYESLISEGGANAPVMAWVDYTANNSFFSNADGNMLVGAVYKISFAAYKVALTDDSGAQSLVQASLGTAPSFALGDDIYFAESEYPNLMACQTAVKEVLKGVDILIDESFVIGNNRTSFLSGWGITPAEQNQMPFLANEKLYSHDKDQTITFYDDWFGEAIARPDLVLLDMRSIVNPGQFSNHTTIFFRNLALNEAQTTAGPQDCTDLPCNAYNNQEPLMIGADADAPAAMTPVVAVTPMAEPVAAPVPTAAAVPDAATPEVEGEVDEGVAAEGVEEDPTVATRETGSAGTAGLAAAAVAAVATGAALLL